MYVRWKFVAQAVADRKAFRHPVKENGRGWKEPELPDETGEGFRPWSRVARSAARAYAPYRRIFAECYGYGGKAGPDRQTRRAWNFVVRSNCPRR